MEKVFTRIEAVEANNESSIVFSDAFDTLIFLYTSDTSSPGYPRTRLHVSVYYDVNSKLKAEEGEEMTLKIMRLDTNIH
jgi:hypothetical protein